MTLVEPNHTLTRHLRDWGSRLQQLVRRVLARRRRLAHRLDDVTDVIAVVIGNAVLLTLGWLIVYLIGTLAVWWNV